MTDKTIVSMDLTGTLKTDSLGETRPALHMLAHHEPESLSIVCVLISNYQNDETCPKERQVWSAFKKDSSPLLLFRNLTNAVIISMPCSLPPAKAHGN